MGSIQLLRRLARARAIGPPSTFTEHHLAKALEIIHGEGAIGRIKLSAELNLGEGATRTLINHLRNANLIKASRAGCSLSKKGEKIVSDLSSKIGRKAIVPRSTITVADHNTAILVKGVGDRIRYGVEQRDAAIRVGASGATTLLYRGGDFIFPPTGESLSVKSPEIAGLLIELFQPEENDVVVISGAETLEKAEEGARAAVWTLLEDT